MKLRTADRRLLNAIQGRFPLVSRPFDAIGQGMGMSGDEVMERLAACKDGGVLRQISAIFDTRRLGYQSVLVAARAPRSRLAEAARVISSHPGVSHNYRRAHHFNLWFTIAVPPGEDLQATVDGMVRDAGVEKARLLPMTRMFKIGVNFDMESFTNQSTADLGTAQVASPNGAASLSEREVGVVRGLQEDLALAPRPFLPVAERLGISEEALFSAAEELKRRGVMRRFGAVLHHRQAGLKANAMVCWRVPEEQAERVGMTLAASPAVSHCYQRSTYPDWPYSHFSMVHARRKADCLAIARGLSAETGVEDYVLLMSTREFKKSRVRYFVEDEWREQAPVATGGR